MSTNTRTDKPLPDEETGRYIIFFHPQAFRETAKLAHKVAGIVMPKTIQDAEFATSSDGWRDKDTIVVPSIGVAITSVSSDQVERLKKNNAKSIRYIRKEFIFEIADPLNENFQVSPDYMRGYQAGVNDVIDGLLNDHADRSAFGISDEFSFRDNSEFTWGLQAIGFDQSRLTGKNIKVAILDTGIDFNHPDFKTRQIHSQSFIAGVTTAQDDNTHGTHCAGTLCGPKKTSEGPRYGVAGSAKLFVGKVMKADGKGNEGDILHGIGWALQNNCRIISLSISKKVNRGESPLKEYEEIGRMALDKNCLLIAAAGNDSNRPGSVNPVTLPANASTVMAIGAVGRELAIYERSNGGINPNGGGIDLVAPGEDVYSSKILPLRYGTATGTSMATPHVAGVAALLMQADPVASAEQIWARLTQTAKRLPLSNTDVGSGLVQISS